MAFFVLFSGNETALGSDPIKEIEHFLGYTAILIFCAMFLLSILLQLLNKPIPDFTPSSWFMGICIGIIARCQLSFLGIRI